MASQRLLKNVSGGEPSPTRSSTSEIDLEHLRVARRRGVPGPAVLSRRRCPDPAGAVVLCRGRCRLGGCKGVVGRPGGRPTTWRGRDRGLSLPVGSGTGRLRRVRFLSVAQDSTPDRETVVRHKLWPDLAPQGTTLPPDRLRRKCQPGQTPQTGGLMRVRRHNERLPDRRARRRPAGPGRAEADGHRRAGEARERACARAAGR